MTSSPLHIRLFGTLDLRRGSTPLPPLDSARAESLLAYLLLHRDAPQPRQSLAFLLWPDSTESQARTNLRHVLHNLRRALPDTEQCIEATSRTLQWRANAPYWLDVAAFEDALARAKAAADGDSIAALREAVDLYTGELLEGCYDDWLSSERERLRVRYVEALSRLTTQLEARGEHADAIQYAERLLKCDPLNEETYRLLMRLHDVRGDRAHALRIYHVCAATLERELGIEPSAQTRTTYEALLPVQREHTEGSPPAGRVGRHALVGRVAEWQRLTTLWRTTGTSGAHMVLVTGEPGIGKSRLVDDFRAWCVHRGATSFNARAYAAEGALAYDPLVAWLRSDAVKARLPRLDRGALRELARLLPEIHSTVDNLAHPDPIPESEQRQRLFDATARAIFAVGEPLLLVADDLQWWDHASLQFLYYLLRVAPATRLLIAATARREEVDDRHPLNDLRAGLHALGRFTEIELGRLSRGETAVLAQQVAGHPLGDGGVDQLFHETEGNPLFVVEALRAGWEHRHDGRGWTSPKVQAVIESRLGQLSEPARGLVGVAATIGRAFTIDVLAAASEVDEQTFVRALDELWRRRIVREQGIDAYDFSHDKIREVAYRALSPAQLRHHHRRIAQALERRQMHDPVTVGAQIAGHYELAGETDEAVTWYERVAHAAQQLSANAEAVNLLDRAYDLLRTLPQTPERDARELEILTALPGPLGSIEGYASRRIFDVHQRADALARTLGVEPAPPLLRSLALASLSTDDFETARQAGQRLRERGERDANDVLLVEAEYVLGISAFWSGDLETARRHFEGAGERYRPEHRRAHLLWYGQDPRVICLSRLGNTLWCLGYPESATRARDAAVALADEIDHSYTHAVVFTFAAHLALEMRDLDSLREWVKALQGARSVLQSRQNRIALESYLGYFEVLGGRPGTGIARIQRALEDSRAARPTPGHQGMVVRVLLEAYAAAGDARTGLAAADRALGPGGIGLIAVEARRLQAEFRAALGAPPADVDAALEQARQVARRQGARMPELRVLVSLIRHRLEHATGRTVRETGDALAALVEALPEARGSSDVREATQLLSRI